MRLPGSKETVGLTFAHAPQVLWAQFKARARRHTGRMTRVRDAEMRPKHLRPEGLWTHA
jgi:hypothetical protein